MKRIRRVIASFSLLFGLIGLIYFSEISPVVVVAESPAQSSDPGFVAVLPMDMIILPGTAAHLQEGIAAAAHDGARALVIELNTPGGVLQTSQEMIQEIFGSPIPVFVYVTPTGASATSAGVFITQAAHVAGMAPGTTIGAAHPVNQEGKDIEGDMRTKAENATTSMVKAIADRRGRNATWAEKSVRESSSITSSEALEQKVVDVIASDIPDLLRQAAGKKVDVAGSPVVLPDFSKLALRRYEVSFRNSLINVVAHPNVLALLWLLATTGLSIELYNPGLILPGVVGGVSLVLALAMSEIIPMNQGAVLLLLFGAGLIGLEIFTGSLVLGISGVVSMTVGTLYLIDTDSAPGMAVSASVVLPSALILGGFLLLSTLAVFRSRKESRAPGKAGLVGEHGRALENFSELGTVSLHGEIWKARAARGVISKDDTVLVSRVLDGLTVEVEKVMEKEKSSP